MKVEKMKKIVNIKEALKILRELKNEYVLFHTMKPFLFCPKCKMIYYFDDLNNIADDGCGSRLIKIPYRQFKVVEDKGKGFIFWGYDIIGEREHFIDLRYVKKIDIFNGDKEEYFIYDI